MLFLLVFVFASCMPNDNLDLKSFIKSSYSPQREQSLRLEFLELPKQKIDVFNEISLNKNEKSVLLEKLLSIESVVLKKYQGVFVTYTYNPNDYLVGMISFQANDIFKHILFVSGNDNYHIWYVNTTSSFDFGNRKKNSYVTFKEFHEYLNKML